MNHTPQAEFERFVKRVALDPRIATAQPGEEITVDTTDDSLYVHIPTPNGVQGMNILSVVLARPK